MPRRQFQTAREAAAFLADLRNKEALKGYEDALLEIAMDETTGEEDFERITATLMPALWPDPDQETFRFNKFMLYRVSERILARSSAAFMRGLALQSLVTEYRDEFKPDAALFDAYVPTAGWAGAADPRAAAVLAVRLADNGRRYEILTELLESEYPWRFSVITTLLQFEDLTDAPQELAARMGAAVQRYLIDDEVCVAAREALSVLTALDADTADEALVEVMRERGEAVLPLVDSEVWSAKFSLDYPKAYAHVLSLAVERQDVQLVPSQPRVDTDTITSAGLAPLFTELVRVLPPADLDALLSSRLDGVQDAWDGLVDALRLRRDDETLSRIVDHFLLKIGAADEPESIMAHAASAGNPLGAGRGYFNSSGLGVFWPDIQSSPPKPTDRVLEIARQWLCDGRWDEQDYACFLLNNAASRDCNVQGTIREAVDRIGGIERASDRNLARLAAENKVYEIAGPIVDRIGVRPDEKLCGLMTMLYQQNFFEDTGMTDQPRYTEISERLSSMLSRFGGLVPQWQQLAGIFDMPYAVELFTAYFEATVGKDIDAELMTTFVNRTMRRGFAGLRSFFRAAMEGTYSFTVVRAFLGALVAEDSKLQGLAKLIPEGREFLREFGYPLLGFRTDVFMTDDDDVFNLMRSLPAPDGSRQRGLLEEQLDMNAHPRVFGALLRHLDPATVHERLEEDVAAVVEEEARRPVLSRNDELKILYWPGDGGEEVLNLTQLIAALGRVGATERVAKLGDAVQEALGPRISVARAMLKSPALYQDLDEEAKVEADTSMLLWSTVLIAHAVADLDPPLAEDPDGRDPAVARGLLLPFEEWTSFDESGIEQIPQLYLTRVFGWVGFDPTDPGALLSGLGIPLSDDHRLNLPHNNFNETETVELVASVLEASADPAVASQKAGTAYIVGVGAGATDDPAPVERSSIDLPTFASIALYLRIESDEEEQFIARVGEDRTIETVAKVLSDTYSDHSVLLYLKEI